MKYLDERIILTVPNLTITEDGLYRYDVAIRDEWDNPSFIGNCFIPKGATKRDIDITDIVKNETDFYKDVDFQAEWQVRIQVNDEWFYSNAETVLPIYRYPNRKDRMETPIKLTDKDYYIPSLQGFDSEKKGEFLPRIPFVSSDKITYDLWMNNGQMTTTPYLYSGVKKDLNNESSGIRKNSWSFEDLWKGDEVQLPLYPAYAVDSTLLSFDNPDEAKHFQITAAGPEVNFDNLPRWVAAIELAGEYKVSDAIPLTYTGTIGSRKCRYQSPTYTTTEGGDWDFYLHSEAAQQIINCYPNVGSSDNCGNAYPISSSSYVDVYIDESSTEATEEYFNTPDNATLEGNNLHFADLKDGIYIVIFRDEDSVKLDSYTVSDVKNNVEIPYWNDKLLTTIEIVGAVDNVVKATITVKDNNEFSGKKKFYLNYDFDTGDGAWVGLYQCLYTGYFSLNVKTTYTITEVAKDVNKLRIQVGEEKFTYRGNQTVISENRISDFIYIDECLTMGDVDNIEDNQVKLSFTPTSDYFVEVWWNKAGADKLRFQDFLSNVTKYTKDSPYVLGIYGNAELFPNCEFTLWIRNAKEDANGAVISVKCKTGILDQKAAGGLRFYLDGDTVVISGMAYYMNTTVTEPEGFDVANIDQCPAHYYLQWRDRYGSMQMQPFGKTETYSEGFTRNEVKNYQDVRRLANVEIQPKWKVNSGWMKDTLYPYYESLFVSPWMKLYDAKEDKVYDVIITDSEYTEKTYKNQGNSLFNLELTLEENKTQKLLY